MADSIRINTQTLIDTASKIRNINDNLENKLAEINQAMNNLEADWESDASTEIRAKMNALKPSFDEYKIVVGSYAKFLDETAQSYESTETAVYNNANNFR